MKLNPHLRKYYKDTKEKGDKKLMECVTNPCVTSNAFSPRTLTSGKVDGDPDA